MCPHIGLCAPFLQVKEVGAGEDEENIVSILPQKTAAYVFYKYIIINIGINRQWPKTYLANKLLYVSTCIYMEIMW